jgi:hypothetical protein
MRTVRDACVLQPNALDIRVSDEVAQLDRAIADEGDGTAFFGRTHITAGLQSLMSEGLARLAGRSPEAIFHLKQAMGGGKTHLLVSMGLLARHPTLRENACPDLHARFPFGTARVAAFNGRYRPQEFFWGEIAKQLGRPQLFVEYWSKGIEAPDEAAWLRLFEGDEPILILLDELPPYFDYYLQRELGEGTMAGVLTYGLATLLTAAAKRKNVCIVVSDLTASYEGGANKINQALANARQEIGRQERLITPVDLAGNEIYDILRKRLFQSLPDRAVIEDIAEEYGRSLAEAGKSKTISRSAEAIADEITHTYPFHPRLKNLIALFKENETFRQTRGLMEFISRLLRSVWGREANDVFLIGAQHFDFGIADVRDGFERIALTREIITRDLWDENHAAHAQVLDLNSGNDSASQVGSLVLTSSLSKAVHAVKGLTREEILECLITPVAEAAKFAQALDALYHESWHMHKTVDDRFYFSPQENLGRMLQSVAESAPEGQVERLKRERLQELFASETGVAYSKVLALPTLDEVKEVVRRHRVLVIMEPDSKIPPEKVTQFFADLTQKNNLCVLSGERTEMAKLDGAARQLWAVQKISARIGEDHEQHGELLKRIEDAEQAFLATTLALFNRVYRPVAKDGKPELRAEALETTRERTKPFSGEKQIEKTLSGDKVAKLILDVEASYDAVRSKAEALLWNGDDRARWTDIIDRANENPGFFWLPPKGLDHLKRLATVKGRWEDLGDGWITKRPEKKKTSAQVTIQAEMDDKGELRLQVTPVHAGPAPQVYYSESMPVTEASHRLAPDLTLTTSALRLFFLVVDPSKLFETGPAKMWENRLKLVCANEYVQNGSRWVELKVLPTGAIRYSLDGSEPRNGTDYDGPVEIGTGEVLLLAFAEADGLETHARFSFPALGTEGEEAVHIDPVLPCTVNGKIEWSGRAEVWRAIEAAIQAGASFANMRVTLGDGDRSAAFTIGADLEVAPEVVSNALKALQDSFEPDSLIAFYARRTKFRTGHDLTTFAEQAGLQLKREQIEQ